jgi:hypothetical protein
VPPLPVLRRVRSLRPGGVGSGLAGAPRAASGAARDARPVRLPFRRGAGPAGGRGGVSDRRPRAAGDGGSPSSRRSRPCPSGAPTDVVGAWCVLALRARRSGLGGAFRLSRVALRMAAGCQGGNGWLARGGGRVGARSWARRPPLRRTELPRNGSGTASRSLVQKRGDLRSPRTAGTGTEVLIDQKDTPADILRGVWRCVQRTGVTPDLAPGFRQEPVGVFGLEGIRALPTRTPGGGRGGSGRLAKAGACRASGVRPPSGSGRGRCGRGGRRPRPPRAAGGPGSPRGRGPRWGCGRSPRPVH